MTDLPITIDASKLRQLEPIDADAEHPGQHGLIVALHGTEPGTRWFDTAAERDETMFELHDAWKEARNIKGVRPEGDVEA